MLTLITLSKKEVIRVDNELQHHGVKGQKWGVRRFQNSDGSLTNEGRRRYSSDDFKDAKKKIDKGKEVVDGATKAKKKAVEKQHEQKIKKDLSEMSDQELRAIVNRLNMEERYTQVMKSRGLEQGKSRVDKILDYAGTALTIGSSALSIAIAIKELKG